MKEEDCGICRQPFDATCPTCKMPGDECPPVWGICDHHYHMHCIWKWTEMARKQHKPAICPLCRQPWEIKVKDTPKDKRKSKSRGSSFLFTDDQLQHIPIGPHLLVPRQIEMNHPNTGNIFGQPVVSGPVYIDNPSQLNEMIISNGALVPYGIPRVPIRVISLDHTPMPSPPSDPSRSLDVNLNYPLSDS